MKRLEPLVRDVYAHFGLAMYVVQCIERWLALMIVTAYDPTHGKLSPSEYDEQLARLSQRTMGQLISELRRSFDVPTDFDQRLGETLRLRNWLAHHYFAQNFGRFTTQQGRSEMIRELDQISDRLNELDEYFDRLLVGWLGFNTGDGASFVQYAQGRMEEA